MEKNGCENFQKLESRVRDSLLDTDLESLFHTLKNIQGATLVSGVGGSSVVSEMASKVLREKNHLITQNVEPRDFCHRSLDGYSNVLSCSYSGKNYGVELSFLNSLKHYLLSSKKSEREDVHPLTYTCRDPEKSFISLAATLIPCSILVDYYLDGNMDQVLEQIVPKTFTFDGKKDIYEIFTGADTSVASKYLDSTMVEAGIGIPILHDKYAYCHGRSTTCLHHDSVAIYFDTHTELDRLFLEELPKHYSEVVKIDVPEGVLGDFVALVSSMYLTKYLADSKNMDLSGVDYHPVVKKLYHYHGGI